MIEPATAFFPLPVPRQAQTEALEFFDDAYAKGYRDIVIAAPTGVGKTGIGAAGCYWAAQPFDTKSEKGGGYYLVTQKLLQDQIERDFPKFKWPAGSLMSAIEYPCCGPYSNCMIGSRRKPVCAAIKQGNCRYRTAKQSFEAAQLAVTNYPFYMTSCLYTKMPSRRLIVCDECHTIERQLMSFVELVIGRDVLYKFAPGLLPLPPFHDREAFLLWLANTYLPVLTKKRKSLDDAVTNSVLTEEVEEALRNNENPQTSLGRRLNELDAHLTKVRIVIQELGDDPDNWVFWQEGDGDAVNTICKPLYVDAFARQFLDRSEIRLYMSAYPGPKRVFCRCLGLQPEDVAWLDLPSSFPKENRLVHLLLVGSMSRSNEQAVLPSLLRMCERILNKHEDQKGIIHCHKYSLGEAINSHLATTKHAGRILFARKARDRQTMLRHHHQSMLPTVLLSPSMAEGFSLDDDLARFQIIAKMPYPYLGDQQIAARKDHDPDWYAMQTVMTVLQACGRIVRSETDFGSTYILDADFERLFQRHGDFFPGWFVESFVDYKKL